MQDFTQGFAIPEPQPTPTPLQPIDTMRYQTAGFGESGTGALIGTLANTNDYVIGINPQTLKYGDSWGRDNTKNILTNNEFVNQAKLLQYLNSQGGDAATALGLAVDAKSALVLRQMLNRGPLSPVTYGDSELTPEILKADQERISAILHRHATVDYSANPALLEAEQQEARDLMSKLVYAQSHEKVSQTLGFNWLDWFAASDTLGGAPNWVLNKLGYDTKSIPKDNSDITSTLSRYDPNFDYVTFFDTTFKDPTARQAMLERGITADYIASSPNADAAMFKISQAVNQSYIQQRLGTYKPTVVDAALGLGSGLVDFMVDTPTGAVLIPLSVVGGVVDLGADLLAGAATSIAGVTAGVEAAANTARVLTIGKNVMQLYRLPLGMAPDWLAGSTLLGHASATGLALATHGALSEYERQKEEIAFGAASLYANPNVRLDVDQHEVLMAGLNGLWQGALFGLGSGLLGSAVGAGKNRLLGVMDENGKRSLTDFRWSLKGTQLGDTIDLFSSRKRSLLDVSPVDRVKTDALLEGRAPTPASLASEVTGRAERVETHEAMVNPTAAEASPADPGARRYTGESIKAWISRVAPNREVRNLPEIATEVARRTTVDATDRRALDSNSTFAQMTPKEQIRTLLQTKSVIADARQAEEASVGLPKERERVYDQLESQRKAWIRHLSKRLTPDEFKMLKQELEDNRKPSALPDLLKLAKDTTKPLAERKAAASEAAAQILEASRAAAITPTRVKVIKQKVPQEVLNTLDAVITEHKLTGNVSETTAEKVRKSLLNPDRIEEATQDINRRVTRALGKNRVDADRANKIRIIGEDHTKFVELARGNKERAQRLADAVDELVQNGVMSPEDRTLLLSSLVHVNFDVKGFDINYKFAENTSENPNTVGDWDRKTRTLTIYRSAAKDGDINIAFLHELGHALFSSDMNGELYMDNLRLFTKMRNDPMSLRSSDPLASSMWEYHFQNAEENFVEMFANVLLTQANSVLTPVETSGVRAVISSIKDAIVHAAQALDESKYYTKANDIITNLVEMDSKLAKNNISVSSMLSALEVGKVLYDKRGLSDTNLGIRLRLKQTHPELVDETVIPVLTEGEAKLLFTTNDPLANIAFAISRKAGEPIISEAGHATTAFTHFVDTYSLYRRVQEASACTRFVVGMSNKNVLLDTSKMSPKERANFIHGILFGEVTDEQIQQRVIALPATYEDRSVAAGRLNTNQYELSFLYDTGEHLIELLEMLPTPGKRVAKALTASQKTALIEKINSDKYMSRPLIELIRERFDRHGLGALVDKLESGVRRDYLQTISGSGKVFNMSRPEGLPDISSMFSVKNKDTTLKAIEDFVGDTKSFNMFAQFHQPKDILTKMFKVEEGMAERLLAAAPSSLKSDAAKLRFALDRLKNGIKKNVLSLTNEGWDREPLKSAKTEVTLPDPKVAAAISASGKKLATQDSLLPVLAKLEQLNLSPQEMDALSYIAGKLLDAESSERKSINKLIAGGVTETHLMRYIRQSATNRFKKEAGREAKRAGSIETEKGTLEGTKIQTSDTTRERELNSEVYSKLLEYNNSVKEKTGTGLFSKQQEELLQLLNETRTVTTTDGKEYVAPLTLKEMAEREGITVTGMSMRIRRLNEAFAKKLGMEVDEISALFKKGLSRETKALQEKFITSVEKLDEELSKENTKAKEKPIPTTKDVQERAIAVLREVAVEQKMDAKAEPVDVPVSEPSTGHAIVETVNIKPDTNHPIVHADTVANAIVSGEPEITKTLVQVTTNKVFTLSGKFTSAKQAFDHLWQIMSDAYPDQIRDVKDRVQFVIDKLKEKGYDAIMDEKGNLIPMEKPKPVGKRAVVVDTTLTPKAGEEVKQETTFTTENNDTPVMTTKTVVEPIKGTTGVIETTTGDKPHVVQPLRRKSSGSEIAKLSAEEQLERKVNEDPKMIRYNGMDRGFLRKFINRYWSSKVEQAGNTTLTARFQKAFGDFVLINSYIAEANRIVFGEDAMERFWAKVDEINANEVLRVKAAKDPKNTKPLSYRQVLDKAAEQMRIEGKPDFVTPVLPEDLHFVREPGPAGSSELTVRLSSRNKRIQSILEAAEKDSAKVTPPPDPVVNTETPEATPRVISTPSEEGSSVPPDKKKVIREWFEKNGANTSRQFKLTGFIGWLVAGDDGPRANWYRKLMNKTANWISSSSQLQNTLCSSMNKVASVARLFEDTLAQTGHVISQGTKAFKTALQCKMEEDMLKTRLVQRFINFRQSLGDKINMKPINEYIYETLFSGKDVNKDELIRLGVNPLAAEKATKLGNELLRFVRDEINADILNKELETGRLNTTDRHGNPADPRTYAPSQIDHELLDTIPEKEIIEAMVRARIKSKLADAKLDRNTMVVLGWLNIKRDPRTGRVGLFSKDAEFWPAEQANMFSNETLSKLRVGTDGKLLPIIDKSAITGEAGKVLRALKEANPDKYIVLETDDKVIMYRMPESVDDLAPADRLRYEEAIRGNTGAYTEFWRKELGGKSLVQREMEELLAYMKKQYPYNVDTMGNNRPMFKVGEDSGRALGVSGLTPQEVFSEATLKNVWRTDLLEAYNYWIHGRYFDLNFQTELDRMFGHTGITIKDLLDEMYESAAADIRKIGKESGWSEKTIQHMLDDLNAGRKRMEFEFRDHADTLPFTPRTAREMLGARTMSASIKYTNSAGWGVKHLADFIREFSKQFPHLVTLPNNIIEAIQHIIGTHRFSKSSYINSTVGDLTSALDHVQTELSNVYLGEQGNTPFGQDSVTGTAVGNMRRRFANARGLREKGVATLEALGDIKQSIGSIGAVLNATRAMAKARLQRSIWHYIKNGALERLMDNLAKPENAELLKALNAEAVENLNKQHPLFKAFAKIARESGFGFDQHDAMRFLKFNFRDKESIEALKWAMKKVGGPDGQVDIRHLYDVAAHAKRSGITEVNPEVLHRAISDYQMMLEDRIRSEAVNEPAGLSRVVNNDINTAGGRLWHSLTSYFRSYQYNLRKNGAAANPWKYAIGTLFMGTVSNSIIAILREWMSGRQVDDIVKEMKDHPSEFFIKGIAHVPWFGVYNGVLDAALAGVSYLNGGTYQFYGTPGMPVGISSGVNAMSGMYTDAKKLISDPKPEQKIASASKLLGFTDVINNTGVGIPVRMMEDMSAIERQSALGSYLQMIHKDPYPYSKQKVKGIGGYNPYILETPPPRNYTMEEHKYIQSLQDRIGKTPQLDPTVVRPTPPKGKKSTTVWNKFDMSNSGVSSPLADLLEGDRSE